jgi:hypothetical protein
MKPKKREKRERVPQWLMHMGVPAHAPARPKAKRAPEPEFACTREEWETRTFLGAAYFRVHRFYSIGRRESFETTDFVEALRSVGREMRLGRQALIYAVTASGRFVCLPKTEYRKYYDLWMQKEVGGQ